VLAAAQAAADGHIVLDAQQVNWPSRCLVVLVEDYHEPSLRPSSSAWGGSTHAGVGVPLRGMKERHSACRSTSAARSAVGRSHPVRRCARVVGVARREVAQLVGKIG